MSSSAPSTSMLDDISAILRSYSLQFHRARSSSHSLSAPALLRVSSRAPKSSVTGSRRSRSSYALRSFWTNAGICSDNRGHGANPD